ncbi:NUDIX hydrolase family protein [Brevibacterium sp. 50QC2O2]|jgi:ADP-ribose pyrophosphatase YjhB (NUDIX family)|uniref:NUDIX hydrolase family protein n=1 Tax=Brevibacterium TaxID=1696 RepID=UPI00211CE581|nr:MULTISPECIES: NUDIX hydrolase family protein [unclassified Brevibacterium]MCQ9368206.1 NUDIX hydrolase family protein [Brevibacterium sp. 91QC2O2]MCQ9385545.1 NUDIX hydrolase family protein [Brevibacterium sp. 68QC2CO]MCQ9389908.1 NUDIX hydrolase family protein [Brevibacterium sp. 50QC2O2]
MTRTALDFDDNWFDPEELVEFRRRLPITYVNAVPVQVDDMGRVERIGLLLRTLASGKLGREIVGGRVRYHESLRTALMRHAEKDLGPLALPEVPASLTPFHVAEYFPTEGIGRYHDPRQHAVALCYILPVRGECAPQQDTLSLDWLTPAEALRDDIVTDMAGGQEHIVRAALAHLGVLP